MANTLSLPCCPHAFCLLLSWKCPVNAALPSTATVAAFVVWQRMRTLVPSPGCAACARPKPNAPPTTLCHALNAPPKPLHAPLNPPCPCLHLGQLVGSSTGDLGHTQECQLILQLVELQQNKDSADVR